MTNKDKNKRILGIAIGLVGFSILFCLSYEFLNFRDGIFMSLIGTISVEITRMDTGCATNHWCEKTAIWLWYGFGIIYFLLVWRYRARINHWTIKIVTLGYKKI